jgi:hypothetical protein
MLFSPFSFVFAGAHKLRPGTPLQVNEIGQGFAMFYESQATYLELRGNFKKAEDVYSEGIKRRDIPSS